MLLRWEQKDLAEASGVSLPSIKRLETQPGELGAQPRTIEAIVQALKKAGVEFIPENGGGVGVRLAKRARRSKQIAGMEFIEENGGGPGVRLRKPTKHKR
jgi:transcriptional regulator with XRE-family HTH domain